MRTEMFYADFKAKAVNLFGVNPHDWKFSCPKCRCVHKVSDWLDAGTKSSAAAQVCLECGFTDPGNLPIFVKEVPLGTGTNECFAFAVPLATGKGLGLF